MISDVVTIGILNHKVSDRCSLRILQFSFQYSGLTDIVSIFQRPRESQKKAEDQTERCSTCLVKVTGK